MKKPGRIVILPHPLCGGMARPAKPPPNMEPGQLMDDDLISDDPGTILESYESLPLALPPGPIVPPPPVARSTQPPAHVDEVAYRSPHRWAAPRVVICDDGSLDQGETVYVRSDRLVIGRTNGDIVIGHDVAMSGSHAEIARRDFRGKYGWVLRDLGSSNGTLARVRTVTLRPGITIMLGSKRYRFELSSVALAQTAADGEPGTALLADLRNPVADAFPALVENVLPGAGTAARYPLRTSLVTVGRSGTPNGIEIDDPCIAKYHAVITRDVTGAWQLESQPSLNGVWVKVDSIKLTDNCSFQCGEQRFRFHL